MPGAGMVRRHRHERPGIAFPMTGGQSVATLFQGRVCIPMPQPEHEQDRIERRIFHGEWTEYLATSFGRPSVADRNATVLQVDAFGDAGLVSGARRAIEEAGIAASPTCVISEAGARGGIQTSSMEGISVVPIFDNGRLIGQAFEDSDAKYCLLGGMYPTDPTASPGAQTEEVFRMIERALAGAGMDFRHVVRTWFYNDHILDWYGDFNRVRTGFFKEHGITLMPASTGIGAPNPAGTALVAKVTAVLPKSGALVVRKAESPLQCEAFAYGSAFSRAVEVAGPHARTLYISGTASIDHGGKTVHAGNAGLQIARTMEVVDAILGAAGMDIGDTTRAIAYFRHPDDIALWHAFCLAKSFPPLPAVAIGCTICRDDLLFEIELDAARRTGG